MSRTPPTPPKPTPTTRRPRTPSPLGVPGWLILVVPLAVALPIVLATEADVGIATPPVLGDPGALVRWGLPVIRVVTHLAAAIALGSLALTQIVGRPHRPALVLAARAATVWAPAALLLTMFDLARAAGLTPLDSGVLRLARVLLLHTAPGIGMVLTVLAASAAAVVLARARTQQQARLGLALVALGVLGIAPGGHAASAVGGQSALVGRVLHLAAMGVWVGGLLALVLLWPALWRDRLAVPAARGFSVMAGWAWALITASGLSTGYAVLGTFDPFGSPYARLLLAKALLVGLLGLLGAWHRWRHLPTLDRTGAQGLLRLALVEIVLMATALAFASVLADTPPPLGPVHSG